MGAPNPKPLRATISVGGRDLQIFAKFNELAPYIGLINPDPIPVDQVTTSTVRSHSRRRYSGGPTTTVDAHPRRRVESPVARRNVLPGNNAYIEEKIGTGEAATTKVETFTFVGNFQDLRDYCRENALKEFTLRSPWGEPFAIAENPGP